MTVWPFWQNDRLGDMPIIFDYVTVRIDTSKHGFNVLKCFTKSHDSEAAGIEANTDSFEPLTVLRERITLTMEPMSCIINQLSDVAILYNNFDLYFIRFVV